MSDERAFTATEQLEELERLIRHGWALELKGMFIELRHPDETQVHSYMTLNEVLNSAVSKKVKEWEMFK